MIPKSTFIITFAHCKGGVGKSTLCYHLAMLFVIYCTNLRIGIIDCDYIQNTTYNFFFNKQTNLSLLIKTNDIQTLQYVIQNEELDILLIDTPAGDTDVIHYVLQNTNILITPVQHSLIDIEALISIENNTIIPGPFSQIIQKYISSKARWILVHNRLPLINIDNKYTDILVKITKFLHASLYELFDRVEYRLSFENKITINEIVHNHTNINSSQITAAKNMKIIYDAIYFLYENNRNKN